MVSGHLGHIKSTKQAEVSALRELTFYLGELIIKMTNSK